MKHPITAAVLKVQICYLVLLCFFGSSSWLHAQNFIYAKGLNNTLPEGGNVLSRGIQVDNLGNTYVAGYFTATADFDPGAGTANLTSAGSNDIFVAKYDASGHYVYANAIGGSGNDNCLGIAINGQGQIYITGQFIGTVDFDPGAGVANLTSAGNGDIFFASYDASGNYVYAKALGGPFGDQGGGIAVDASGNVYITGFFNGPADFDPGPGVATLNSSNYEDIFVAKYDASGNYVYASARIGCIDQGYSIAVDGSGNAYITGVVSRQASTSICINDIIIAKYDTSGNNVYTKLLGGTGSDAGRSIAIDGSGNVYATGTFAGTAVFAPGANLTSSGGTDIFVAKYDPSGNYVYAKAIGGTGNDRGNGITVDGSGNAYVTGYFNGTADFDPGAGIANLTSAGSDDIFVARYDASGNYIYAKAMGGAGSDVGYGIALNGSGNPNITGTFMLTADFDPGIGVINLSIGGGYVTNAFVTSQSNAGSFLWASQLGNYTRTDKSDQGRSIAVDAFGNTHITGYFSGTVDFDPGPGEARLTSIASEDIFLAKYDASGNYVYAKSMGGYVGNADIGNGIAVDGSGNVYITGSFVGTADFDPGPGVANLTSVRFIDAFIAKYDALGNYVYAIDIGSNDDDYGNGIAVDIQGNVTVIGGLFDTADFDPGPGVFNLYARGTFIARYDASGNFVFAKALQSTLSVMGKAIAVDDLGNAYITGDFRDTVDFDPGPGVAKLISVRNGSHDIFVAKYDASGNYVYAKSMGSEDDDYGYGITVDGPGNVYVTGFFSGTADFDPNASEANLASNGGRDVFIARYDASGNYVYAKAIGDAGNDEGYGIAVDGAGHAYITGSLSGTVDFDPGPGIANLSSAGDLDIFLARYDASGNYVYAKAMGGTGADIGYSIALDSSNYSHLTGSFGGTADFDPGGVSINSIITATTFNDIFIAKYGSSTGLPVDLISFTAKPTNNGAAVQVNWTTASETNNAFFEVERSRDGVYFEAIGRRPGCSTCTRIQQYEFMDNTPYSGLSYYRLKQVDYDNSFSYSSIAPVNLITSVNTTIQVFPTITNGAYEIRIKNNPFKKQVVIRLLNAAGSLIKQQAVWLNVGDNRFNYTLADQARGVYYISVGDINGKLVSTVSIIRK